MSEQTKEQSDGNDLETGEQWRLYVDGASNAKGSGVGMVFITPEGAVIERAVSLGFNASNNEAEYEALLSGLRMAKDLGIVWMKAHCDSQLVANQLTGEYAARDERMAAYVAEAQCLIREIGDVMII